MTHFLLWAERKVKIVKAKYKYVGVNFLLHRAVKKAPIILSL